ncbi:venom allergen 5-like [Prorops nasuta]|uniref:venom allergen 5-like n=1 Tax=Prorops nasuta TaxID=863751 RepID=UPI0034CED608
MRYILNPSLYFYLFAAIFVGIQAFTDYCNKKCSGTSGKHTKCLYASGYGPNCNRVVRSGLTPQEISVLLDKHNEFRAFVASGKEKRGSPGPQPAAVHMPSLIWDDEIASIAQTWANQCQFSSDECRDVKRFQVGQNIHIMTSTYRANPDLAGVVEEWYNGVTHFKSSQVTKFTPEHLFDIGSYTQIVWAKTTRLGCGLTEYRSSSNYWNIFVVCNYGPSGNYYNRPVYQPK